MASDSLATGIGLGGMSALSNILGGALSSEMQYKKQSALMKQQYEYNRQMTHDQYLLMSQGMRQAGLNPAAGLQGSPVQASAPSASAPAIAGADFASSVLNSAQIDKIKAETANIESKTPNEVEKLKAETDYYHSMNNLNEYLAKNREADTLLKKAQVDLTNMQVVGETLKAGSLVVDLKYAQDKQALYSSVVNSLADLLGVDPKKLGGLAQVVSGAVSSFFDFAGKRNIASNVGRNKQPSHQYHSHNHYGDSYDIKAHSFSNSK